MKSRVAILGTAPSIVDTPWDDEDLEIWALGHFKWATNAIGQDQLKRADKLFEMHSDEHILKETGKPVEEHFKDNDTPIFMQDIHKDIPKCLKFPRAELKKFFGREYYQNLACYMIAYAIYSGVKEIHLYGVHFSRDTEYAHERPGAEYWLGQAEGRGIKLWIHSQSDLLYIASQYGYNDASPEMDDLKYRIKIAEASKRKSFEDLAIAAMNRGAAAGKIEALQQLLNNKGNKEKIIEEAKKAIPELQKALERFEVQFEGLKNTRHYLDGQLSILKLSLNMLAKRGYGNIGDMVEQTYNEG